jgi:hypothetical protein
MTTPATVNDVRPTTATSNQYVTGFGINVGNVTPAARADPL